MSDTPIEPQDYTCGLKVVDIGDIRVARGQTRRPRSSCRHRHMVYDKAERRVWCEDCESEVEPFDALMLIAEQMDGHVKRLHKDFASGVTSTGREMARAARDKRQNSGRKG